MNQFEVNDICAVFQEKQSQHVRHFHFHGWPEIGIPAEGRGMIDIIAAVQRQQQQSGNRPIIVHCRWGTSVWHFCSTMCSFSRTLHTVYYIMYLSTHAFHTTSFILAALLLPDRRNPSYRKEFQFYGCNFVPCECLLQWILHFASADLEFSAETIYVIPYKDLAVKALIRT